ncbi:hypothetical protein QBC42DRAFT_313896 [Cladorrhinum samala]|uniref:Rhodopsin domain-containing protein n=1 Tax=Cladorrhinum samala TaxID=585594 RepID=A0AAV9HCZ2_9PEZI|nr:hypothetical protein QBC42DRAFT_313896 [Cladorrhinum samala]
MRRLISFFGFGTILLLAISTTKALAIETFLAAVNGTDKSSELGEIRPGWALPVAGGNVSVPECAYPCFKEDLDSEQKNCDYITNATYIDALESGLCGLDPRSSKIYLWLPMMVTCMGWFFLGVYFYSRWIITDHLYKPNDYLMMLCTITFTIASTFQYLLTRTAFGLDIWNVGLEELSRGLKFLYIGEPFYLATITIAKLQLLTFYHETFRRTAFATYFRVGFVFVLSTNLGLLVADIVQCVPISANWEWVANYMSPDSSPPAANCVDISLLITTAGGLNILQELIIIGLFLYPVVFVLPFSSKERRCKAAAGVKRENNLSWDFTPALVWTNVEMAITVIVACAPAVKAWSRRNVTDSVIGRRGNGVQEIIGPHGRLAVGRKPKQDNRMSQAATLITRASQAATVVGSEIAGPSNLAGKYCTEMPQSPMGGRGFDRVGQVTSSPQ